MDDEMVLTSASDDTGRGVDASPTDEQAAVAPPGRSRLAVAMFVVAGLLLIGALVFGVLGMQAQSEASDRHDEAVAAIQRRHELADQQHQLEGERSDLEDKVLGLPDKYDAIGASFAGLASAHDHYVDLLQESVNRYNAGDTAGSVSVLDTDGAAAISDLQSKKAAMQQSLQTAEQAMHDIQEGL